MGKGNRQNGRMGIAESYKTLELEPGASLTDIRKAYKDMVRVWHPDRFTGNPRLRAKATEKLKEINIAYGEIRKFLKNSPVPTIEGKEENFNGTRDDNLKKKELSIRNFLGLPFFFLRSIFSGILSKDICHNWVFQNTKIQKKSWNVERKHSSNPSTVSAGKCRETSRRKRFSEIMDEVAEARKSQAKH